MSKKIIFLDIDGVLNTAFTRKRNEYIDDFRVKLLSDIVQQTNAKIVLTSTWRFGFKRTFFGLKPINNSTKALVEHLSKHHLKIYDILPDSPNEQRTYDVLVYIRTHNIQKFVVIDDEEFNFQSPQFKEHFFKTEFNTSNEQSSGLTQKITERIIKYFN